MSDLTPEQAQRARDISRGQSISAGPSATDEFIMNQRRTQPVRHASRLGFTQRFRGIVPTNSQITLQTNGIILNTVNHELLRGGHSEFTIFSSNSRDGVPGAMSAAAPSKDPSKKGAAMRAVGKVSALKNIVSVIRGPLDQILEMEVLFGEQHWKGTYVNGQTYRFRSETASEFALIKLKLNNPFNSAYFNMFTSLRIVPTEPKEDDSGGVLEALRRMPGAIRKFAENHSPF